MKKTTLISSILGLSLSIPMAGCANSDTFTAEEPTVNYPESFNDSDSPALASETPGFTDAPSTNGREVIFEDDFTNTTGIPDPEKWVLCEKSKSDWARYLSESYDQAYTKDGSLYLIGEQKDGEYLTGGIETRGKF